MRNNYWLLRHGRSKANEAGIIVSSLANGLKQEFALTAKGQQQATAAGKLLAAQLAALATSSINGPEAPGCFAVETQETKAAALGSRPARAETATQPGSAAAERQLFMYSSPFSRAFETASLAAAELGFQSCDPRLQVAPELRERFFGDALELQSDSNYPRVWQQDANDLTVGPSGGGESVMDVSVRLQQLFSRLEQQHAGCNILLVAHGDTLSILWATLETNDLKAHRQHGLQTGELRRLF
ncbi:hypothetical protein WJX72_011025 [[Myrmecia] bisecta]|uniref:Phosphoglycerate mutase n=1 Tax=[Myrmecia] bisecta TaxID=41462 RepID=A0AAW1P4N9_9CHLO